MAIRLAAQTDAQERIPTVAWTSRTKSYGLRDNLRLTARSLKFLAKAAGKLARGLDRTTRNWTALALRALWRSAEATCVEAVFIMFGQPCASDLAPAANARARAAAGYPLVTSASAIAGGCAADHAGRNPPCCAKPRDPTRPECRSATSASPGARPGRFESDTAAPKSGGSLRQRSPAQPPSRVVGTVTGVLPFVVATVVWSGALTTCPVHSANATPLLTARAKSANSPRVIDFIGSFRLCGPPLT